MLLTKVDIRTCIALALSRVSNLPVRHGPPISPIPRGSTCLNTISLHLRLAVILLLPFVHHHLASGVILSLFSLNRKTLSITGLDHIRPLQLRQAIASHRQQGSIGQRYGIQLHGNHSSCNLLTAGFHVGCGFCHIPSDRQIAMWKLIVHV